MQPRNPSDTSQPAAAPASELPPLPAAPVLSSPPPAVAPEPAAAPGAPPSMADDGDLIEKEWVVQVKHILSSNAGNPFEQNKQLTRLKADYMQKRYGKDIKVDG